MIGNENRPEHVESEPGKKYLELSAAHGIVALAIAAVLAGIAGFTPAAGGKGLLVYAGLAAFVLGTFTAYAVIFKDD